MYRDWPLTEAAYTLEEWRVVIHKVGLRANRVGDENTKQLAIGFAEHFGRRYRHLTNEYSLRGGDWYMKEMEAATRPHTMHVPDDYREFFNAEVARYQASQDRRIARNNTKQETAS